MKVLMINSSSNEHGCTYTALKEIEKTLLSEGIESEILQLGAKAYHDCTGCCACRNSLNGRCVFNDIVNELIEKAEQADGFIFGTPVYYAHPTGRLLSVLNRAFFASSKSFTYKPAASIASARRAGTTASLDVINKYFTINQMPIVSSTYWPMVHGKTPEDVQQDLEGLQTMRNLARNMAYNLKLIELGKQNGLKPSQNEREFFTNFIR